MSADPTQFEEPILRIRRRIDELTALESEPAREAEIAELRTKLTKVSSEIYSNLTPWQKTLVARNAQRPYTLDFIAMMFEEWTEIHGDRKFWDDMAVVTGFARFRGTPCCVIGHQKGRNTKEKIARNFGQPRPEGFRKALAGDEAGGEIQAADLHLHRHARARIPASAPKSADRPRPSP